MKNQIDVLVIGTDPPCPRCDLLNRLVAETASPQVHIRLRHCSFDSPEALEIGRDLQCKIGTAKHVAKEAGITVDWGAVYAMIRSGKILVGPDSRPADRWTPELDALLEPCRDIAESVGYLMTPILLVNGSVKHHGSVPSRREIARWLTE